MNRLARSTALAAVALALACSACAGTDNPATTPTHTSTAPAASQSTTPATPDTSTTPAAPASTTEAASTQPSASQTSTATQTTTASTPTQPSGSAVNPAQYLGNAGVGEGHYFVTGPLICGMSNELAGCHSTQLVPSLPKCDSPDSNAPLVTMKRTGAVTVECTNQGIFLAEPAAQELPVGATLTVRGWACSVLAKGSVRCESGSGGAFVANSETFAKA